MFGTFCCSLLLTCSVPILRTDPWSGRYYFRYGHKTQADYNPSICAYITWHHWEQSVMKIWNQLLCICPHRCRFDRGACVYSAFRLFLPSSAPFVFVVPQTKPSRRAEPDMFFCWLSSSRGPEGTLPTWVNLVSSLSVAAVADCSLFWVTHSWTVNTDVYGKKEMLSML